MPEISVGDLTISPPLALAPMVGLSHSALRSLVLEEGGVGLLFTEMLAARKLPEESSCSPFLMRGAEENPLFYQLFLTDEDAIPPAVDRLQRLDAQGVDLNLGCPAPQLRRQGAGVFLTADPGRVGQLIRTLRKSTSLPVSVKIRLGESLEKEKLVEFCRMLEGEGIDLLTVHARMNGEKFCRKPRWEWIAPIKKALRVPVIANGGIFTVADAQNCLQLSGADGLMLGRGAARQPWLFADIAREVYGIAEAGSGRDRQCVYFRFIELLQERFAVERRLGRMKQFTHYFAENFQFGHLLATGVQKSNTVEEALERAADFFQQTIC